MNQSYKLLIRNLRKRKNEKQERILLILDEFQELFVQEDNIKRDAKEIFDRILVQISSGETPADRNIE